MTSAIIVFAVLLAGGCSKGPDPWSPETYPLEVKPYEKDPGVLPPAWNRYEIKGIEERSYFYAHDDMDSVITTTFTCGKYQDITLDKLAAHHVIPMGKDVKVISKGYIESADPPVYHIVARGEYKYHGEELYIEEGLVPDLYTELVMNAYVVGEPHCVVDIVYAASPNNYESGLPHFREHVSALGVPLASNDDYKAEE